MASGWMKSLQCKSRALDDVINPSPKHHLLPSSSCKSSSQSVKDVIHPSVKQQPSKPRLHHHRRRHSLHHNPPKSSSVSPSPKPDPLPPRSLSARAPSSDSSSSSIFPSLTELPEGHPSRNVVEIIFHTSWGDKPFSGRLEMICKVQNGPRTVAKFEEYRESVKTRAALLASCGSDSLDENSRCAADGNEMMRFHCGGPAHDACVGAWVFPAGMSVKGGGAGGICTFSGSGVAHESAGGGRGRRVMLVCRVIAGRVSKKRIGLESLLDGRIGFDSVSGDNGELLVYDSRAVLPCFLIIYKL